MSPNGRLGFRFSANAEYIKYLHDRFGQEMLTSYTERHYAPGKLLELVWDREYGGKWLDAASRMSVCTQDAALTSLTADFAAALLNTQHVDGYVGIKLPTDREPDDWEQSWDLWNQWYALTGFLTFYELFKRPEFLVAADKVGSWIVRNHGPIEDGAAPFLGGNEHGMCNMAIIDQLLRLFHHTGKDELVHFVNSAIHFFQLIEQMKTSKNPTLSHAYMLCAILGGVAELAFIKQDLDTLSWVEEVWGNIAEKHQYPTGSLGLGESLRENAPNDTPDFPHQETCATVEWIFFTQKLYEITGKVRYIDVLEHTIYNALLGAQAENGMKWTYYTPLRYHKDWFHGPTKCCYWSGPRGVARVPQLIYALREEDLYLNLFESSTAELATGRGDVHISQTSEFPENGKSTVTLRLPKEWSGALQIRQPTWAKKMRISQNGKSLANAGKTEGYFEVPLKGSREHSIEIVFDVPFFYNAFADGYYLKRGPEILAIDVRDNIQAALTDGWISFPNKVEPRQSESEGTRRRYSAKMKYRSSGELRPLLFTPYADAGNDGAAFRVVFPEAEAKGT